MELLKEIRGRFDGRVVSINVLNNDTTDRDIFTKMMGHRGKTWNLALDWKSGDESRVNLVLSVMGEFDLNDLNALQKDYEDMKEFEPDDVKSAVQDHIRKMNTETTKVNWTKDIAEKYIERNFLPHNVKSAV